MVLIIGVIERDRCGYWGLGCWKYGDGALIKLIGKLLDLGGKIIYLVLLKDNLSVSIFYFNKCIILRVV